MLDPDLPSYNVGGYIELPFAVDLPRLRRAYEILTQRHDALRIRLHTNERGLPEQSFEGSVDFEMPLHDLSGSASAMMGFGDPGIGFDQHVQQFSLLIRSRAAVYETGWDGNDVLVQEGFDPQFGARPIKRALRRLLEDPLAEELLRNRFKDAAVITVDRNDERLVFNETPTESEKEAPVQE